MLQRTPATNLMVDLIFNFLTLSTNMYTCLFMTDRRTKYTNVCRVPDYLLYSGTCKHYRMWDFLLWRKTLKSVKLSELMENGHTNALRFTKDYFSSSLDNLSTENNTLSVHTIIVKFQANKVWYIIYDMVRSLTTLWLQEPILCNLCCIIIEQNQPALYIKYSISIYL